MYIKIVRDKWVIYHIRIDNRVPVHPTAQRFTLILYFLSNLLTY